MKSLLKSLLKSSVILLILAVVALATLQANAAGPAPVNETGDGTQIGAHPWSGLGGWGAQPTAQQPAGTDPYTALQAFGLIASGTSTTARAWSVFTLTTGTASPITTALVAPVGTLDLVKTGTSAALYLKLTGTGSAGWGLVTTGTGP